MKKITCALVTVGYVALFNAAHAGVIDTTASWDGNSAIAPFGEIYSATYGQTFRVTGSDTRLDNWTFHVDDIINQLDFAFYVMDWNAAIAQATGSILYQSNPVSTTNNGGTGGIEAFTFETNGVNLEAGNDYIAFISTAGVGTARSLNNIPGVGTVGTLFDESVYSDGSFFWQNNRNSQSTWNTQQWLSNPDYGDLAFTATFSTVSNSVAEPTSLALLGLGMAGLGFMRKKKNPS